MTHFFHYNILTYCPERQFISIEDHNEYLIKSWNDNVTDNDIIIHLGDFAFGHPGKAKSILDQLHGIKILVPGNHDFKNLKSSAFRSYWRVISHSLLELEVLDQYLVLCHFPIESWNHMYHGSIHLHGHCHSNRTYGLKPSFKKNRLDVGVDYHQMTPLSLREVLLEIEKVNLECQSSSVENFF